MAADCQVFGGSPVIADGGLITMVTGQRAFRKSFFWKPPIRD